MLNRLKHIGNAALLGLGAGLNFGCAIVGGVLAFMELVNATSKNPSNKVYTIEATAKDIPKETEEENHDDPEPEEA